MTYDIFICYRRKGGYQTAKHLYDLLTRDGYRVSFDIDTLRNGEFDTALLRRVDACTDFILILDRDAFARSVDPAFPRSKDWLRNELAHALERKKNVVPIMLEGFTSFPDNLPADIARVARMNGPKYDKYYFDDFYRRLKERFLDTPPPQPIKTAPTAPAPAGQGATIHVETDLACRIVRFGKEISRARPGEDTVLRLLKGRHKVTFVSEENPADRVLQEIQIADNQMEDFVQVGLRAVKTARERRERNRRRAEEQRIQLDREFEKRRRKESEAEKQRQKELQAALEKEKNKPRTLKILENIHLGLTLICGILFFVGPFIDQIWVSISGLISFFVIGFGGNMLLKRLFPIDY